MFLHIWMSLHKILMGHTKDSPSSRVIPKKLFSVILKNAKIHIYIFEASVGQLSGQHHWVPHVFLSIHILKK